MNFAQRNGAQLLGLSSVRPRESGREPSTHHQRTLPPPDGRSGAPPAPPPGANTARLFPISRRATRVGQYPQDVRQSSRRKVPRALRELPRAERADALEAIRYTQSPGSTNV